MNNNIDKAVDHDNEMRKQARKYGTGWTTVSELLESSCLYQKEKSFIIQLNRLAMP